MILTAKKLVEEIRRGSRVDEQGIAIVPMPDIEKIDKDGEASINLRLGRWFVTMRQSNETHIETIKDVVQFNENKFSKKHFVLFGESFNIHPGRFVLASTLEWIRVPNKYAAYVVGKFTLGRRGIIIETAAGVHPGFSGCLTLEIANVGEVPVRLHPGMMIFQLFVHVLEGELQGSNTKLSGQRKPRLGQLRDDPVMSKLMKPRR
jgi:dCTP deaminase